MYASPSPIAKIKTDTQIRFRGAIPSSQFFVPQSEIILQSGDDLAVWVEDKVRQDMERNDKHIEREKQREQIEIQKQREEIELQKQREEIEIQKQRNGFKSKFLSVKPQDDEDFGTFINRAKRYFDRWVELWGVSTLEGLSYLICSEIALQACDEDFVAYVKDRSPSVMVSLKAVASAYIDARPNKCFCKKPSVSFSARAEPEPYCPSVCAFDKGNGRSNWPRSQRGVGSGDYPS
ncbi:hypothetical protein PoB_004397300 [Plakobranchus ocellatus]|uniref:SCAN box domain-containing protein n=1 Tax=Plakobranchus ocellatus TaxID=259542 RepID=A0AAV4BD40_9GAST|nr:hypothetical protein PoB_004397300 [Plakobranchus ocellatus]